LSPWVTAPATTTSWLDLIKQTRPHQAYPSWVPTERIKPLAHKFAAMGEAQLPHQNTACIQTVR